MRFILATLFLLFLNEKTFAAATPASPLEGTYAGFAKMDDVSLKLPMVMHVIYYSEGKDNKATFIIRLSLGGFSSHEYQAYSFTIDQFEHTKPNLILDRAGVADSDDLSILGGKVSKDRKTITGDLQSVRAGLLRGRFEIVYLDPTDDEENVRKRVFAIEPGTPIMPTITGTYRSQCPKREGLQIEAARTSSFNHAEIATFSGFMIAGRLTTNNLKALFNNQLRSPTGATNPAWHILDGTKNHLVVRALSTFQGDLEFDFFRGNLLLVSSDTSYCRIEAKGIRCAECFFERQNDPVSKEILELLSSDDLPIQSRLTHLKGSTFSTEAQIDRSSKADDVEGEYLGTIHFDPVNKTRALSIRVNLSGLPNASDTLGDRYLSLAMEKHFAREFDNGDWKRVYPYHLGRSQLGSDVRGKVFNGNFGEVVQISSWSKSEIAGTLYSHAFGKLGDFEVFRRGDLEIESAFNTLSRRGCLDGFYQNTEVVDGMRLETAISIALSPERASPDALFPYALSGFFGLKIDLQSPVIPLPMAWDREPLLGHLAGSTYDPFTAVGLLRTIGGMTIFGKFDDTEAVFHTAPNHLFGQVRPTQRALHYRRTSQNPWKASVY